MPATLPAGDPTRRLPFAYGGPTLRGRLRAAPEDFVVEEDLGYAASGDGEHAFLAVRKRERNTHEVARALARHAGVRQVAVGYAGLKDRNAVTTQYFTVQLPGRDTPDWSQLEDDSLQIQDLGRHNRKIRRGSLRGNRFVIRVSAVEGDRALAEARLAQIAAGGVPNYFGAQRFGRDGQNLVRVDALFGGRGRRPNREQQGLLLSAARSHLFNLVLQARVSDHSWNRSLAGDVMALSGSQRQFMYDPEDPSIASRLDEMDLHPTGPLCGRPGHALSPAAQAALLEDGVLADWADWVAGLQRFGLEADRRALRLAVDDLVWEWQDGALLLRFGLVAGAYATALSRELVGEPA